MFQVPVAMGWANPKHKGLKQEQSYYPAIIWNSWVQGPIKAHVTRPQNVCWVSSEPWKFAHLFYEITLWSCHELPTYPSICQQLGWFTQPSLWCPNHLQVKYISLSKFTLLLNKQDTGYRLEGPLPVKTERTSLRLIRNSSQQLLRLSMCGQSTFHVLWKVHVRRL